MRATCLTCAVLLLATEPAAAETLYNQDGVRLSATVQEIDPGGATCRVREEGDTSARPLPAASGGLQESAPSTDPEEKEPP